MLPELDHSKFNYKDAGTTSEQLSTEQLAEVAATTDVLFRTFGMRPLGPGLGGDVSDAQLATYIEPLLSQYSQIDTANWIFAQQSTAHLNNPIRTLHEYYRHVMYDQSDVDGSMSSTRDISDNLVVMFPCQLTLRTTLTTDNALIWRLYNLIDDDSNYPEGAKAGYMMAEAECHPFDGYTDHSRPKVNGLNPKTNRVTRELPTSRWVEIMAAAALSVKDPNRFKIDAYEQDLALLREPINEPPILRI